MSRHVLITGGAGYIGSHTCKALAEMGYTPLCYDNLVYGHPWSVKWGPFVEGDILDREKLDKAIQKYRPEAVLHFAAYAYVGESVENPGKYYRNNTLGSLNLLEAMRDHGINRMVFSSTCATYGEPEKLPIPEDHPQKPINPYGASKLMIERMLQDFDNAHGIRSIALRYFNAAGADPAIEIGEDHDPETHLVPLVLDVAAERRPFITVFGNDYDTDDGTCIRDYIHVTDLAAAHVYALKALAGGKPSSAFNLGNGRGVSVNQVIDTARQVTGCHIPVEFGPRRAGDPAVLIGDASRFMKEFDWQPKYSELEQIIETAWNWHLRKEKKS
jgi:UDP-arabinose 4-epimerase